MGQTHPILAYLTQNQKECSSPSLSVGILSCVCLLPVYCHGICTCLHLNTSYTYITIYPHECVFFACLWAPGGLEELICIYMYISFPSQYSGRHRSDAQWILCWLDCFKLFSLRQWTRRSCIIICSISSVLLGEKKRQAYWKIRNVYNLKPCSKGRIYLSNFTLALYILLDGLLKAVLCFCFSCLLLPQSDC